MPYLHEHKDFKSLLDIVADEMGIEAGLVEKDYWIMHNCTLIHLSISY
jgi:hypothetical protein